MILNNSLNLNNIDFEDFDSRFPDDYTLWNNNEKDLEKNIKYITFRCFI